MSGAAGAPTGGHVEVEGLTWRPFGAPAPLLDAIDLDIPAGQRVLLVGASGAGKSTLLRALAGLVDAVEQGELSGSVTIDGRAPQDRAGTVGLVLQEPGAGVVAGTVGRDVAFGPENVGADPAGIPVTCRAALGAVGLDLPLDTPTSALSGGQTQRLALAGALALQPDVLLLDEPTAMLDHETAAEVRDAVDRVVAERGLTLVVVEHLVEPWVGLVDRVLVLGDGGRVLLDGPPLEIFQRHRDELLQLGVWLPGAPPPEPAAVPLAPPASAAVTTTGGFDVVRETALRTGEIRRRTTARIGPWTAGAGDVAALTGRSGAGKSTVLAALAGSVAEVVGDPPRTGDADPRDLDSRALAARVGWVPQWTGAGLVARSVLDEMLATTRAVTPENEVVAREQAVTLLEAVGLGGRAEQDAITLSGGEQRRLAAASAVLHRPGVVLADEPTAGLDRRAWSAVTGVLSGHARAGGSVVVATHDPALVALAGSVTRIDPVPRPDPGPPPRPPLVARVGPLAPLLALLLAAVAGLVSPGWRVSLGLVAAEVVLGVALLAAPGRRGIPDSGPPRRRARSVLLRLAPGAIAAVLLGWSSWLLGGQRIGPALDAMTRLLVMIVPASVLVAWIDTDELAVHLARRLGLPARPAVAFGAALGRIEAFRATWDEVAAVRRVRGVGPRRSLLPPVRTIGAMTFTVLVRVLGSAVELSTAMDARGFAKAERRTWVTPARWGKGDTLLTLAFALLPVGALAVRFLR